MKTPRQPEPAPAPAPAPLLTTKEACAYLKVSTTTLYILAQLHKIKRIKLGRCTRWRLEDVQRLIDECARRPGR